MLRNYISNVLWYGLCWGIEGLLIICYPVVGLLRFFLPLNTVQAGAEQKVPIILVEQWVIQNIYHIYLKWYLEKRGFQVYTFNYSLFIGGIDDGAKALSEFIVKNNIKKCILIGVSIGAVAAYLYAQRHHGWKRIERLMCLAGPFHGTPIAYLFPFLKTARQLTPGSEFTRSLLIDENPYLERVVSITPKHDELVPIKSGVLPGTKHIQIDIAGHNNLHIWSRKVFTLIAAESQKL